MRLYLILLLSHIALAQAGAQQLAPDDSLIKSIYFGGGSYYINPSQASDLAKFIGSFPNIDQYTITIHSHTDDIGSPEYNQLLSEMRSEMTIRELTKLKVPRNIISIHDFGEFNPVYDNSTLEGRLRNRRVDIILWPRESL